MGKTKYQISWQKDYDWVQSSTKSINHAYCIPCAADISIASGVNQLQAHEKTVKHLENTKSMSNQATFVVSNVGSVALNAGTKRKILTTKEQISRSEIIRCLDIVDSNCSFNVANKDAQKYKTMFPDSEIAKAYKQKSDKVKYTLQFGIAPYLKKIILSDLIDLPFTFGFDETTTSQIKKQYDAYACYHSSHFGQIVTVYLGTLFVGRCTADDLLNHFYELLEKIGLRPECIISLGMDGPNVNLAFKRKLESELMKKGVSLIDVGSCPLHTCSNAFLEGLKVLTLESSIDFDQFVLDLFGFFKLSAKRIKDYFEVESFTEIQGRRMMKHVSTRWISLQDVLVRVMEQLDNLQEYFLNVLPTEKGFKGKYGIGASERYIRIKKNLTNKKLPVVAYAIIYFAQDFKNFTVPLQSKQPMITVLHSKMIKLVTELMSKFLLDDTFISDSKSLKSTTRLRKLDLNDEKLQKVRL